MKRVSTILAVGAAVAFTLGPSAFAQQTQQHKTPMLADGHPDLTGIWLPANGGINNGSGRVAKQFPDGSKLYALFTAPADSEDKDPTGASVFASEGREERRAAAKAKAAADPTAANLPPYKAELQAKVDELNSDTVHNDPAFRCGQQGLPRIGAPVHVYSVPGRVVLVYAGYFNVIREVATDNRPHDTADQDTNYGDSVGHWEGNTLVIDSIGFNDKTWIGGGANLHSTKMHVVEKFTRVGDALKYEVTVEDPGVFTRPWVQRPRNLKIVDKDESGYDALEEAAQCDEREQTHMHFGDL